MFALAIGVVVGAFIGWTVPQPAWAVALQAKFKDAVSNA
jgi:hypothetical protein